MRIVDYKSSEKELSFNKVLNGLQLQLFAYMDTYLEAEKDSRPAAVLYFNLSPSVAETPIGDENPEKKDRLTGAAVCGRMSGHKGVAELEADEMKTVLRYVRRALSRTAREIYSGRMPISPVQTGNRLKCDFCPYHDLCRFGDFGRQGTVREIPSGTGMEAIEIMRKETEADTDEA